jgi:hypothetical protein
MYQGDTLQGLRPPDLNQTCVLLNIAVSVLPSPMLSARKSGLHSTNTISLQDRRRFASLLAPLWLPQWGDG